MDFTSGETANQPLTSEEFFSIQAETVPDDYLRTSIFQGSIIFGTGILMSLMVIGILSVLRKG